ncbi:MULTISPECIES: sugar ABC transporter permease [unclassified Oceanispirochaeta]|uniref:ABC transporter permease n=1 Tax=unclassified Oceanispirochaeta TaxID=2635722 RepID=UPI000E091F91|nr:MULTISPECIES: ABC transporter permease subunit [unclassified Oceanispirochaeta]MBF9014273.1 sugar ABC transporter permease [Oceanispirochaeta sp. M2]NPD71159.1 sugar ABC transporter permease [Oceanispirochaeta sp. M1]RDG33551.1 sugar ABC transporter permease [Oceanispirochaeta sp. M1]
MNKINSNSTIKKIINYRLLYALILPGLLYVLIFRYIPLLGTVVAFKKVPTFATIEQIIAADWVGLYQFKKFVNSHYFWNILGNTFKLAGLRMIFEFGAPVILALLMNEIRNSYFKKFVQTVSYMPYFISTVVLAGLVFNVLSLQGGIIPELIRRFGGEAAYYLGDTRSFRGVLLAAIVWKNIGWGTIIYLAALSGIDPQLYEASRIDGAGRWTQTIHISLPSISFAVVIMFLLRISVVLNQGFEETLLLYSPAVYEVSDIIDTYVYRVGLLQNQASFASAVGLFKSLLALALVLLSNTVAKKFSNHSLYG